MDSNALSMANDRVEWVEIIEPKSKEHMYANLTTGECVWDPPVGVPVKKTDNNQWWELFDENTSRFYYYNATSQKTVWHRPQNSDIIPLAKLQTLKQNTEPVNDLTLEKKHKESVATQTPGRTNNRIQTAVVTSTRPIRTLDGNENTNLLIKPSVPRQAVVSCETQTSPISPRRNHHHHHHHHHHHRHNQQSSSQGNASSRKLNQNPWYSRTAHSQDSGRSSDSSSLSQQSSCVKSAEGANLVPGSAKKTPLVEINSMPPSGLSKPIVPHIQRSFSNASQQLNKQKSFDVDISVGGGYSLGYESRGNCTRSKPVIMSSSLNTGGNPINRSQSFAQQRSPAASGLLNSSPSATTDYEEEDSMHEKYFSPHVLSMHGKKSLETTPLISRRKHHSETSSPTVSSGASSFKASTPDYVNFINPPPAPPGTQTVSSMTSRSSSSNSSTLASFAKHQLPLLKSKSEGISSSCEDFREDDVTRSSSVSASSSPPTAATPPRKLYHSKSTNLPVENIDEIESAIIRSASNHLAGSSSHRAYGVGSGVDRKSASPLDNKMPLYSNVKYSYSESHSPILPLDQYIREQAVLSGCYKFGDRVTEEGEESMQSEDENLRVEYDSDEFADDEGMSNLEDEDSSSQEYLHDENPPPFLAEEFRSSSRHKKYTTDGRVCDYVVDGVESRLAASTGHYYNVTPGCLTPGSMGTDTYQSSSSAQLPSNLVCHINPVLGSRSASPGSIPSLETQHTSLKRRKDPPQQTPALYSPILERSERLVNIASQNTYFYRKNFTRRSDHAITYRDDMSRPSLNKDKKLPSDSDIEKYAQDNLNIHKKGIFRKKSSVRAMLSWSKDPISKPMLVLSDKSLKRDACEMFKLVQIYMGDRKTKIGMTSTNIALEICNMAYTKTALRDELYIQICRQTTENPRKEGLRRGWELLAICLAFFPPTPKFQAYLDSYMNRHRDPSYDFAEVGKWPIHVQVSHYATVACKRLERVGVNGKRAPKKPTLDEIDQARIQIFRPSMFGSTLEEIMNLQKERFPHYRLPWMQTTLSEQILHLQGSETEGIFRVPADMDEVMSLKNLLDRWEVPDEITDAHVPASLLKLWYRELYEPLIPDSMYEQCVAYHDNPDRVLAIIEKLPEINKLVLAYLVNFLQMFAKPEISQITKMDASNLAMVMAPNCLRCTSQDPRVIFDNARKEMVFIRTLIQHMDTRFIEGVF